MSAWLVVVISGLAGAAFGELLDLANSLTHFHKYPWELAHGGHEALGCRKYAALCAARLILGVGAALVVWDGFGPMHGPVPVHVMITLGAAGLASEPVLERLGRALPK
jgi:hypothetical protein